MRTSRTVSLLLAFVCLPLLVWTLSGHAAKQPATAVFSQALSSQDDEKKLSRILKAYHLYAIDYKKIKDEVKTRGKLRLNLPDGNYDLELEPNNLRSPSIKWTATTDKGEIEVPVTPSSTYKGTVAGHPQSQVRLSARDDHFSGYVRIGDEWIFMERLDRMIPGAKRNQMVVYRNKDVREEARGVCGVGALQKRAHPLLNKSRNLIHPALRSLQPPESLPAQGYEYSFQVATDADIEFTLLADFADPDPDTPDVNDNVTDILNTVDGIFQSDLGLHIEIVYQHVYLTKNDPYTTENAADLLEQFKERWAEDDRKDRRGDVTHLFTGKDLDGGTVGVAYNGQVCKDTDNSFSLSSRTIGALDFLNDSEQAIITAHEIGHNFGADHDDEVVPQANDCEGADATIMCSKANFKGSKHFSGRSKDDIGTHAGAFDSCLNLIKTPPRVQCKNIVIEADQNCHASVTAQDVAALADDPDGGPVRLYLIDSDENAIPEPVGFNLPGSRVLTLRVFDDEHYPATCKSIVTVTDATNPQFLTFPSDITVTTTGCSAVVNYTVTARDNCGVPSILNHPASGSTFPVGTTTVTSRLFDQSSNSTLRTFNVTVLTPTTTTVTPFAEGIYSDEVTLSATVGAGCPNFTGHLQFSVGGSNVGAPVPVNGPGFYTLPYVVPLQEDSYFVEARFTSATSGVLNSRGAHVLTVNREDTIVTASTSNPSTVQVNTGGGTAGPITLSAEIVEVSDGSAGNTSNAVPVTFTMVPVAQGSAISCTTNTGSGGGVGGKLTASCTFTNVPVNVYDVNITIDGRYYRGSTDTVLAVYDPAQGFVTGGGTVMANGERASFAFNFKYLKSGQTQGSLLYIRHGVGGVEKLKSNAIDSVSIVGDTAVIIGKATINRAGSWGFRVTAIDQDYLGTGDKFGFQLTNPSNGGIFENRSYQPVALTSGDIKVPQRARVSLESLNSPLVAYKSDNAFEQWLKGFWNRAGLFIEP